MNIKYMHVSATQLFLCIKKIGELDAEFFFKFNLLIFFGYMLVIYFQIPSEQSNILINFISIKLLQKCCTDGGIFGCIAGLQIC